MKKLHVSENRSAIWKSFQPALVTLIAMGLLVIMVIGRGRWDPLELARIGTYYSEGNPDGTQGYDGQFVYYIAREIHPENVARMLDVPAYRYQRILTPLITRILVFGHIEWIPWALPLLGLAAHAAGTWAVAGLLMNWGVSPWYALSYGFWVGFSLAIRLDLPEPFAYALIAGAFLAHERNKFIWSWILFGLAVFAKEVTILFVGAVILSYTFQQKWRSIIGLTLVGLIPFGMFQLWLYKVFGEFGIGSGGAMATPFELIPFMGFIRIIIASPMYGLAMLVVFGPAILFPAVWGIFLSVKKLNQGKTNMVVFSLLLNALAILLLPFSTFRETGGLLRFSCGLVLSVLLFSGYYQIRSALRYSYLWSVLNVFLLKS